METKKSLTYANKPHEDYHSGKSFLLSIGINEYQNFTHLNNAVKDAEDITHLLQEKYDINEVITLKDKEATHTRIISTLDALKKKVSPDDKLLIFYSGHGHLDENKKGYWIPTDAEKDNTANYIRNSTIRDYMEDIPAKHTLLISDSCFSGSLFVRGVERSSVAISELEKRKSRWALCSGRHNEQVFDGEPGTNSPFTGSILDLLRTNTLPKLNIGKLAESVMEMTSSNYHQLPEGNPVFGVGHKGGQYIFQLKENETEDWEKCREENTLDAYRQFIQQYPEGNYYEEADRQVKILEEESLWKKATQIHTMGAYDDYLEKYLNGKYSEEAQNKINHLQEEEDWSIAKRKNDIPSYRQYVRKYPKGKNAQTALDQIHRIREDRRQKKAIEEQLSETEPKPVERPREEIIDPFEEGWKRLQKNLSHPDLTAQSKVDLMEEYLIEFPDSPHSITVKKEHDLILLNMTNKKKVLPSFLKFFVKPKPG
ncbi:MAG: caspase family protein [Bacteroidetes bacterium]|nr:caspase family protein [Bacteroidota bacterium]MCB0843843.1 caspase family protein [Bacteroidota bacterium]